jgi:hypothetical protein
MRRAPRGLKEDSRQKNRKIQGFLPIAGMISKDVERLREDASHS